MRPRTPSASPCSIRPFSTARPSCFSILPSPLSRMPWSISRTTTSYPDCADTWVMPWPMRPQPRTPTVLISIECLRSHLRAGGAYPQTGTLTFVPVIEVEDRGAVRHLVLQRPEKRNALNGELIQALGGAIEEAAADESVRVVILRGAGPMFSSGMDVNDLRALSERPEGLRAYRRPIPSWWNLLEEMPKPTICQIHGAALGGAFELALACDFRTMAEDAVAGIMEVRIGLLPDVGGCSRLPAVVGLGNAKELIMTGKVIDGREAHRIGFANRIAPAGELAATTDALVNELLACAPRAVGLAKRVLDAAAKPALALTLEQEVAAQETLAASE